jgi:hypothetical protein
MDLPKCPRCGKPVDSGNFYIHSMTLKCPSCNYSGPPGAKGASLYERMKDQREAPPRDPFEDALSLQSVFSKFALAGFILSLTLVWFPELRPVAFASFSASVLFSCMYCFVRLKGN